MAIPKIFSSFGNGLLDFMFPEYCPGCQELLLQEEFGICLSCMAKLPLTDFHLYGNNPVFKQLQARIPISHASSAFYFKKGNSVQRIIHEIKYHKAWKAAKALGRFYGPLLFSNPGFREIDCLIPVPLHPKRLEERGFNQSEEFCKGLSEVNKIPILKNHLIRAKNSKSQTQKERKDRFDLLKKDFFIVNGRELTNKKILLVDDIITTGATMEACGDLLYNKSGIPINLVSIAFTLI